MAVLNDEKLFVLIADDEPAIRKLISDLLRKEGFKILAADDGKSALQKARNHDGPIDLLITDVMMPSLDGFDLRERILQERPGMRILVISGQLDEEITGEDFPILRKPFTPEQLLGKVREIVGRPAREAD